MIRNLSAALWILLCFAAPISFAAANETHKSIEAVTKDGSRHTVHVFSYINSNGTREVRIESGAMLRFADGINPTLGYGRDLDDDGTIDTWFMYDYEEGYKTYQAQGQAPWSYDVIQNKLFRSYSSTAKMHIDAVVSSLLSYVSIAVSHAYESQQELDWEMMDLAELKIRIARQQLLGPHQISAKQLALANQLLAEAYTRAIQRFDAATGKEYWTLGGADVGLWATGGIVMRWAGAALSSSVKFIGKLGAPLGSGLKPIMEKFVGKIQVNLAAAATELKFTRNASLQVAVRAMNKAAFRKAYRSMARTLIAKGRIGRAVYKAQKTILVGAGEVAKQWKYIAFSTGIQVAAETEAHGNEVQDSDPAVMARKVLGQPEIQQNVGYMTMETVLMTAMGGVVKRRGMRFLACGFIALTDSAVINVFIKRDHDYKRIALDTGWEVGIGNAQVMADLTAINYFEKLATRTNRKEVKLLGYVVAFVDQAVGYYTYSRATSALNSASSAPAATPVLVPVYADAN